MKSLSKFILVFATVCLTSSYGSSSFADNSQKEKAGKPTSSAIASPSPTLTSSPVLVSTWLSPQNGSSATSTSSPALIRVNSGAAIPIKFRLFNSGAEIKSTSNVSVSATYVTCPLVSSSPTTGNLQNSTPGKSLKSNSTSSNLKYSTNSFNLVWKSMKNQTGCFQFKVSSLAGILNSPIFIFTNSGK